MGGVAVDNNGAASVTLGDAFSALTRVLRFDAAGALAHEVSVTSLGFGPNIVVDARDRVLGHPYGEPLLAIAPDSEPVSIALTEPFTDRLLTHRASSTLAHVAGVESLALTDLDGAALFSGFVNFRSALPGLLSVNAYAVEPTGAVVVFTTVDTNGDFASDASAMSRVFADGTIDTALAPSGIRLINEVDPETGELATVRAAIVADDGRILLALMEPPFTNVTVRALSDDGATDPDFGDAGFAHTVIEAGLLHAATSLAVANDGTVYVAGELIHPQGPITGSFVASLTAAGAPREEPLRMRFSNRTLLTESVACGPTACFVVGAASDALTVLARLR